MFINMFFYYYKNFRDNMIALMKFFFRLLIILCMIPKMLVFGLFYYILLFIVTGNVRMHFINRYPKIIRKYFYGAQYISPTRTVIWFIVATNKELQEAKQNGLEVEIIEFTKKMLARYRYPKWAIPEVQVGLVSMEKIDAAGGYLAYFS